MIALLGLKRNMKTSAKGLQFIREQEGSVDHIYTAITGHLTVGVGHLVQLGEIFPNQLTNEEIDALLAVDVERFEDAVNGYGLDLTQNQFDVLVDFAFNCGESALAKLLSHGLEDVPNQLPKWNRSGGRVLKALVRRRALEVEMCNT